MDTKSYTFQKCDNLGCEEPATFIMQVNDLVFFAYCEKHGLAHGCRRGIPAAPVIEMTIDEK